MKNLIFFGEHGITSTNANYLANIAQELIVKDKELLEGMVFYNGYVDIIGSESKPKQTIIGKDEEYVKNIPNVLNRIAKMNAFCAWMREAVKAKDDMLNEVYATSIVAWAKDRYPYMDTITRYTEEDALNDLSIKERCEYLTLEAYASTIGKSVHDKGDFNKARKNAHKKVNNPVEAIGTGKDTIINSYESSVDVTVIDSVYEQLQSTQRNYESRLNAIKFKLKETVTNINHKIAEEYDKKRNEYDSAMSKLVVEFNDWKDAERQRISKLKIIIPNELQGTFEYLNSVGQVAKS